MINGAPACFHINAQADWPEGSTDRLWSDENWHRGAAGQLSYFFVVSGSLSKVFARSSSYLDVLDDFCAVSSCDMKNRML